MMIEVRCHEPAHGFKLGDCLGLLFKLTPLGDLEVKCHRCHKIQIVPRRTLEKHRFSYAST